MLSGLLTLFYSHIVILSWHRLYERIVHPIIVRNRASDPMSKKRSIFETGEAFAGDELTISQIDAFQKKKSKFHNPDLISQEEIEQMKQGLADAISRPVNIRTTSSHEGKRRVNENKVKFSESVNEELLFTQFDNKRGKKGSFVTHNFDTNSVYYAQLYTWPLFNSVIESVMRPIYYLGQGHQQQPPKLGQSRLTLQKRVASGIIECLDLVNGIEDIMGCMTIRLILKNERVVFLFEWYEEPLFLFMIAFGVPGCSINGLTLHRSDLFVAHQVDAIDPDEDDRERRIMMGAVDEKLREGMEEIPCAKAETTFISFYGQKIDIEAIEALKKNKMTYIGYGYILNEESKDCNVLFT